MDKAPPLVQLAFSDGHVPPPIQQDLSTMLHRPVQPVTGRILICTIRAALRREFPSAKARIAISNIAGSAFKSESPSRTAPSYSAPQARHNAHSWT
jgi:hypothetical protein